MLRKSGIILVVLIVVTTLVMASASAASANKTKITGTNGWVVTPKSSTTASANLFTANNVAYHYIVACQTDWYSGAIYNSQGFTVDLNWGNSANSLQLTVFCPDGSVLGPYSDGADGRIDGRVCLYFSQGGATIPSGMYYEEVYGDKVTGSQSYTIAG